MMPWVACCWPVAFDTHAEHVDCGLGACLKLWQRDALNESTRLKFAGIATPGPCSSASANQNGQALDTFQLLVVLNLERIYSESIRGHMGNGCAACNTELVGQGISRSRQDVFGDRASHLVLAAGRSVPRQGL